MARDSRLLQAAQQVPASEHINQGGGRLRGLPLPEHISKNCKSSKLENLIPNSNHDGFLLAKR